MKKGVITFICIQPLPPITDCILRHSSIASEKIPAWTFLISVKFISRLETSAIVKLAVLFVFF